MKEGPSGSAIRWLIPSHRKLLWPKGTLIRLCAIEGAGNSSRRQSIGANLLLPRRQIGRGEAVSSNLPRPIGAFLEDEELLVRFSAFRTCRVDCDHAGRI